MHDFEEELKGRFKDAASTEGVDADQLWADIAAELPTSSVPPPKKKRYRWLWLSLLLLIPLFWLLLSPQGEEQSVPMATEGIEGQAADSYVNPSSTQESPSLPETPISSNDAEPTQTGKITTPRDADDEGSTKLKGDRSARHDEQPTLATENPSLLSSDPKDQAAPQPASSSPTSFTVESPVASNESSASKGDVTPTDPDQPQITTTNEARDLLAVSAGQSAVDREVLPLALLGSKKTFLPSTSLVLEFSDPRPRVNSAKSNRIQLGAFAGLQFWSDAYAQQGSLGETLREAHSSQAGYSVSLEVGYQLRSNWEIRSGLEYVQSYTQFNFVQNWDTVMFRPNVPDTEIIDALATRTVKHQNQQQFISIPLMLGTTLKRGRLSLGLNTGVGLNWLLKQSGKSLNSQEVITSYEQNGTAGTPYSKFFWSAQLQPYAQYRINEGMAIQLRPSLRWQIHGNSAFYGLKHQSLLSGLSVGLLF